jgi:hypothetical protein
MPLALACPLWCGPHDRLGHWWQLEAALRGRDGGEPLDEPWLVYRLCDWAEDCPVAFEEWEMESIPQLKANALDRLVAAGKIREFDREHVTFIVRTIAHPLKLVGASNFAFDCRFYEYKP